MKADKGYSNTFEIKNINGRVSEGIFANSVISGILRFSRSVGLISKMLFRKNYFLRFSLSIKESRASIFVYLTDILLKYSL